MRILQANGQSKLVAKIQEVRASTANTNDDIRDLVESILLIGNYSNAFTIIREDAVTGDFDNALRILEKSVAMGYRGGFGHYNDWRFFAYNDFLVDSIRDHPRFQAAIAVIEADMAQQLENVRAMQRKGEIPTLEEVRAQIPVAVEGSGP